MGPLSEAASYMLEEFHRTQVLGHGFFSPDAKVFGTKSDKRPDRSLEKSFFAQLERNSGGSFHPGCGNRRVSSPPNSRKCSLSR